MSIPAILYWLVGISAGFMMFAAFKNGGGKSLWFWKSLILLGLCGFALLRQLSGLAEVIGLLWGFFFLLPSLGFSLVQRRVAQGEYAQAQALATLLKTIHPGDGWSDYPDLLHALILAQSGKPDIAATILNRFDRSYSPIAIQAKLTLFRIEGRWQDCLNWLDALPRSLKLHQSPTLITAYARCLGETQNYTRFFELIENHLASLLQRPKEFHQLTILALAFGGQWLILKHFLGRPSTSYLAQTQAFWLSTSLMTAGQFDLAQVQLEQLRASSSDQALQTAVESRLRSPLKPSAPYLSATIQQGFHNLEKMYSPQSNRYDFSQRSSGLFWVTWGILFANIGMFLVQIQRGGAESGEVLYAMGGLWPPDVWQGEYWRLIAVNFLHSGPLHLGMNMLGLLILGPFVERIMGWFKFFLIYSASGIGAGFCIAYLPLWLHTEPEFTVGASGAIMGLVGSIAAITLWGWIVERVAIAARRFRTVLFMIGIQLAFDFSTPQISITGHLSGMIVGFVVTLLVILLLGFKEPSPTSFSG